MTALDTDDLAVITGPLAVLGDPDAVHLVPGEVVRVVELEDTEDGTVYVYGMESELSQYIDATSLTPLSEIQDDSTTKWGDLLDPNYVHDYVWTGDYEGDE